MAEEVGDACRQYVAENAKFHDGLPEADAIGVLCRDFRHYAKQELGWSDLDYHIDVERLAGDVLRSYRGT